MKKVKLNILKLSFILILILLTPSISHAFVSFPDKIDTLQERKNIQTVLNEVMIPSPNLKVDGVLGRVSIQTIQSFQESHGLTPDGKVGAITRATLESAQSGNTATTILSCTTGSSFDPNTGLPCTTTTSSSLNLSRTLKLTVPRMTGNDIKELQVYLNNHGYNVGTPDGVYGTGTSKAIATFQQSNNLTSDGSLGPTTLSYLTKLSNSTKIDGCLSNTGFNTITGAPCGKTTPSVIGGGGGGGGGSTPKPKIILDTIKPIVTSFTIPTNSASLIIPVILAATDNKAVTEYVITESSTSPTTGWTATLPTSYISQTQGSHTLYAWARDLAGNISTPVSQTITIAIPPDATATTYTLTGPSSGTVNTQSSIFTITPNNLYTGTITITPTGLSPITKTFTNSSTSQTFTITPNTTGTITLTPSNNSSLINPSSITYVSNASITVPSAPTNVSALAGNASASVSFTTPSSNGGSVITSYTVTSSPGNITTTGLNSPITVSGLTNGTSYTFTVKAINAIGSSVASSASSAVIPTLPSDTTLPTITAFVIPATATSLTVPITTFTATDNVGVTGYLLTESATKPLASAGGWTGTAPATYTFGSVLGVSIYNFTKDLKIGQTNDDVTKLQDYLIKNNYLKITKATGYFGSKTQEAVKAFQKVKNLEIDGIVGKLTRNELNK